LLGPALIASCVLITACSSENSGASVTNGSGTSTGGSTASSLSTATTRKAARRHSPDTAKASFSHHPALVPPGFQREVIGQNDVVSIAVTPLTGGRAEAFGNPQPPHAWSTIKPVIAAAVLRARRAGDLPGGRRPTPTEVLLIKRAIENSDNLAAADLFAELGSTDEATPKLQRVLARSGDDQTHVNAQPLRPGFSTYGQTTWSLAHGSLFYRELANGCLLDGADWRLILNAMANVTAAGGRTWGLPAAGFHDLRLKSGWGPERGLTAYTALQYGIVGRARTGGYVIAIAAQTHGSAESAYALVTETARRAGAALAGRHGLRGHPAC
jgi:hypothetical protein